MKVQQKAAEDRAKAEKERIAAREEAAKQKAATEARAKAEKEELMREKQARSKLEQQAFLGGLCRLWNPFALLVNVLEYMVSEKVHSTSGKHHAIRMVCIKKLAYANRQCSGIELCSHERECLNQISWRFLQDNWRSQLDCYSLKNSW